jgi:hypothetical protein
VSMMPCRKLSPCRIPGPWHARFDSQAEAVLDQGGVHYLRGTQERLRTIQALVGYGPHGCLPDSAEDRGRVSRRW